MTPLQPIHRRAAAIWRRVYIVMLICSGLFAGLVVNGCNTAPSRTLAEDMRLERFAAYLGEECAALPAAAPVARADADFRRKGRDSVGGYVVTFPPAFESKDGAYNLVMHFHGNTDAVAESYERAGINAVVLIANIGISSRVYEKRFQAPLSLRRVVGQMNRVLKKRGLKKPHLNRLGLTSWSAGYAAIRQILRLKDGKAWTDSVLLFDGLHAGFRPEARTTVDLRAVTPLLRFARRSLTEDRAFALAHSQLDPHQIGSVKEVSDAMLKELAVSRKPWRVAPPRIKLECLDGVVGDKGIIALVPMTLAKQGGLVVQEYTGTTADHHNAHLFQMSQTLLPILKRRFDKPLATPLRPWPKAKRAH